MCSVQVARPEADRQKLSNSTPSRHPEDMDQSAIARLVVAALTTSLG